MNKLEITKLVVRIIVGSGTTKIATQIIANNVSCEDTKDKIQVVVAGTAIGMMVKDAVKEYTDAKIDSFAETWKEFRSKDEPVVVVTNL